MHIIPQQFRVVVKYLLEVRNHPALIHRVSMKSAGKLVVNPTARHLLKRHDKRLASLLVVAVHGQFQQQVERRRMRKLRLRSESAIALVKLAQSRLGNLVHQCKTQLRAAAREAFVVLDRDVYKRQPPQER